MIKFKLNGFFIKYKQQFILATITYSVVFFFATVNLNYGLDYNEIKSHIGTYNNLVGDRYDSISKEIVEIEKFKKLNYTYKLFSIYSKEDYIKNYFTVVKYIYDIDGVLIVNVNSKFENEIHNDVENKLEKLQKKYLNMNFNFFVSLYILIFGSPFVLSILNFIFSHQKKQL